MKMGIFLLLRADKATMMFLILRLKTSLKDFALSTLETHTMHARPSSPWDKPTQRVETVAHSAMDMGKHFFTPIVHAMRSTSIALVPYLIVLAMLILGNELSSTQVIEPIYAMPLTVARILLWQMYPVAFMLFFAYQYASHLSINKVICAALCLMSVIFYNAFIYGLGWEGFVKTSFLQAVVIPIVNIQVIRLIRKIMLGRRTSNKNDEIAQEITDAFNLIVPFILTSMISIALFISIDPMLDWVKDLMYGFFYTIGNDSFLFIRMLFIHAFWSMGLHGVNTFDLLVNSHLLTSVLTSLASQHSDSTINYQTIDFNFYNLFVLHGGAGSVLSLCIVLIIASSDKHAKRIGLISFPFVIFNISEILIFGLPIIFNRILLIPFFIVPIVNYLMAYMVYAGDMLNFSHMTPSWTTPIFLNSYLAGNGSWLGPAVQMVQLITGIAIYWYFVKKYTLAQSSSKSISRLITSLDLSEEIGKTGDQGFYKAQKKIIQAHTQLNDIIAILEKHKLEMFYQPKRHANGAKLQHFEGLLRIRLSPTEIRGPFFLSTLEEAGFASVIDLWVCDAVKRDIDHWRSLDLHPIISINLHPDTVSNPSMIRMIGDKMKGYPVDFEIIERGDVSTEAVVKNITHLRSQGFKVALDDFGTGYSGFGVINNVPLDTLKIDKSLLDATSHAAGREVFQASIRLCKQLKMTSVVEGVETEAQMQYAIQSGIDYLQGYHTGRPMPSSEVVEALRARG